MDGKAPENAIWENPSFPTVFGGALTLHKDGTVNKQLALYRIEDGKLTFLKNTKAGE